MMRRSRQRGCGVVDGDSQPKYISLLCSLCIWKVRPEAINDMRKSRTIRRLHRFSLYIYLSAFFLTLYFTTYGLTFSYYDPGLTVVYFGQHAHSDTDDGARTRRKKLTCSSAALPNAAQDLKSENSDLTLRCRLASMPRIHVIFSCLLPAAKKLKQQQREQAGKRPSVHRRVDLMSNKTGSNEISNK